MKINELDLNKNIMVIAEIGNNHEGDYSLAQEMIFKAKEVGANAVKFQTIIPEKLISLENPNRINSLKKFQLSYKQYEKLASYAKELDIIFLSTPFDIESVDFLNSLVPAFKIASGDNNFYPLLKKVALTRKPIILSAGLISQDELELIIKYIKTCWEKNNICQQIAVLHCVSNYPVLFKNANLLSIKYLEDKFDDIMIGYSDHTLGIDACLLAASIGARIIEKHFTIDKKHSNFRDHSLSADPREMKELIERIRNIEVLLGKYEKVIISEEKEMKKQLRRSIAAKNNLNAGHIIEKNDITWLRPGIGIPAGQEEKIIGKKLKKDLCSGSLIFFNNLIDI